MARDRPEADITPPRFKHKQFLPQFAARETPQGREVSGVFSSRPAPFSQQDNQMETMLFVVVAILCTLLAVLWLSPKITAHFRKQDPVRSASTNYAPLSDHPATTAATVETMINNRIVEVQRTVSDEFEHVDQQMQAIDAKLDEIIAKINETA